MDLKKYSTQFLNKALDYFQQQHRHLQQSYNNTDDTKLVSNKRDDNQETQAQEPITISQTSQDDSKDLTTKVAVIISVLLFVVICLIFVKLFVMYLRRQRMKLVVQQEKQHAINRNQVTTPEIGLMIQNQDSEKCEIEVQDPKINNYIEDTQHNQNKKQTLKMKSLRLRMEQQALIESIIQEALEEQRQQREIQKRQSELQIHQQEDKLEHSNEQHSPPKTLQNHNSNQQVQLIDINNVEYLWNNMVNINQRQQDENEEREELGNSLLQPPQSNIIVIEHRVVSNPSRPQASQNLSLYYNSDDIDVSQASIAQSMSMSSNRTVSGGGGRSSRRRLLRSPIKLKQKKKQIKLEKILENHTTQGQYEIGFVEFGENTCCICFEDYEQDKLIRKINDCGHLFHSSCLENWFKSKIKEPKCPLCNFIII